MDRKPFNPSTVHPLWEPEQVSEFIDKKFNIIASEQQRELEHTILDSIKNTVKGFEYLLVVDGQLRNVQQEREIVLKLSTLHTLFAVLEHKTNSGMTFIDASEFTGTVVGRDFAQTIIENMIDDQILLDYRGYLDLWCRLDTRAAWGIFKNIRLFANEDYASLRIDNPISYSKEIVLSPEAIIRFLKGYIYGVVDEGFRTLDFLYRYSNVYRLPNKASTVKSVDMEIKENQAFIKIVLEDPKFTNATDQLYYSYYIRNKIDLYCLRRSIEFALKELFGIDTTSYISMHRLLKILERGGVNKIDFESAHQLYQDLSDYAHRGKEPDNIPALINQTKYFLSQLMFYKISRSVIKNIMRKEKFEEPSQKDILQLEQEVARDVRTAIESIEGVKDRLKEIQHYSSMSDKLDEIIPYYENCIIDLQETEKKASIEGDNALEVVREKIKEYKSKIEKLQAEKAAIEQKLKVLKSEEDEA